MSGLNSWLFPFSKIPYFSRLYHYFKRYGVLKLAPPLIFSQFSIKLTPHILETDHPINKKFVFEVWGPKPTCMPNFIEF